jgi:hypothetical protein
MILALLVFYTCWLESRTCGINQGVAGSSPARGDVGGVACYASFLVHHFDFGTICTHYHFILAYLKKRKSYCS